MTTHDTAGKVPKNNSGKVAGRQAPRKGQPPSLELERKWRRIISQWKVSGLDGRAFIRAHDLPEASFYGWKRTLRLRDEVLARQAKRVTAKRRALGKVSKGAASHRQGKHKRVTVAKKASAAPAFVPVSVTPPPVIAAIELVLPGGMTLRVPAGFDEATLTRLLCALERP